MKLGQAGNVSSREADEDDEKSQCSESRTCGSGPFSKSGLEHKTFFYYDNDVLMPPPHPPRGGCEPGGAFCSHVTRFSPPKVGLCVFC